MRPKSREEEDKVHRHAEFGNVPSYLQDRKEEWAEAEERRRAEMPDPDCPPGMTLMPEEERQETLKQLQDSEKQVQQALYKLPLHVTTLGLKKKKEALEAKLREIENAKSIFSRPKVFITP